MPRRKLVHVGALGLSVALASVSCSAPGHVRWGADDPNRPRMMVEVGRDVDAAEATLLTEGTIVVKQPDVWGQDRMTTFRRDVEDQLKAELNHFHLILSARRSTSEQTAIDANMGVAGVLVPSMPGGPKGGPAPAPTPESRSDLAADRDKQVGIANTALAGATPTAGSATALTLRDRFQGIAQTDGALGLEPQIYLDEKKRYLDHLNELRRINLGDDVSDSAGYGLYLVRMPVSIQPGTATKEGWGGLLTATLRPEFGPDFLACTYRNLVINDLVDQLAPVVYELIRVGDWQEPLAAYEDAFRAFDDQGKTPEAHRRLILAVGHLRLNRTPQARVGKSSYPVPVSDLDRVFLVENLCRIARDAEARLRTRDPRGTAIRAYLRHELEAAYDLMKGRPLAPGPLANPDLIETFADQVRDRLFESKPGQEPADFKGTGVEPNALAGSYRDLTVGLPGNLRQRSLGALCWAIAVDAGLLNRQLRDEIRRLNGQGGFACPPDLDALLFYLPQPGPAADEVFRAYVRARWPLTVFALDPVADQQNVADAAHSGLDLRFALASAFVAGNLGFNQLIRLTKEVERNAETVALNRTITAFALGTDTFGWRFTPRLQARASDHHERHRPKPGLEAGQRELTAVLIMPSLLRRARIELASNWFPLDQPAVRLIGSDTMLEEGRLVLNLRREVEGVCDVSAYRPDDLSRLRTKVDQVEAMLPLQTRFVDVPYENCLGGFELFTEGATALRPELIGYEGADIVDTDRSTDIFLTGRHVSIYETEVIAGGRLVDPRDIDIISREVVRVRLPQGVRGTAIKAGVSGDRECVEIHLATPNGVSNSLMIPLGQPSPPPAEFVVEVNPSGAVTRGLVGPRCSLQVPAAGMSPAATLTVEFTLTLSGDKTLSVKIDEPVPYDAGAGAYVLRKVHLDALADKLAHTVVPNWTGQLPDRPLDIDLLPKSTGPVIPLRVRLTVRRVDPPPEKPRATPETTTLQPLPSTPAAGPSK